MLIALAPSVQDTYDECWQAQYAEFAFQGMNIGMTGVQGFSEFYLYAGNILGGVDFVEIGAPNGVACSSVFTRDACPVGLHIVLVSYRLVTSVQFGQVSWGARGRGI